MTDVTHRNRVTKGVATGGQFAREKLSESAGGTGALTTARPNTPGVPARRPDHEVLDGALGRYGLTVDDVPGLAEAWEARYGHQPELESVDDVADEILGGIDYGRHRGGPWLVTLDKDDTWGSANDLVNEGGESGDGSPERYDPAEHILAFQVHTRNGGGNRECWNAYEDDDCEGCTGCTMDDLQEHPLHLTDVDSWGDSTYADIFFKVPEEHTERALAAHRNTSAVEGQQVQNNELKAVEAGEVPPWHVLRGGVKPVSAAAWELRSARSRMDITAQAVTEAELRYAYLDGTAEPASGHHRGSFVTESEMRAAREAQIPGATAIRDDHLAEVHRGLRSTKTSADKWGAMEAQALALPDGDLKSWLLDDRPERTYQTKEKQGRRNVTVTKSYTPKGELAGKVADARRALGDRQAAYDKSKALLDFVHAGRTSRAQEAQAAFVEAERGYQDSWRSGFTGDPEACPPAPEVQ